MLKGVGAMLATMRYQLVTYTRRLEAAFAWAVAGYNDHSRYTAAGFLHAAAATKAADGVLNIVPTRAAPNPSAPAIIPPLAKEPSGPRVPKSLKWPPTIEAIEQWLHEINRGPGIDAFNPSKINNCGQCAIAVQLRLSGRFPYATHRIAPGVTGSGAITSREVEAATGLRMVRTTPSKIAQYLISRGPGSHTVIGVDRRKATGHWFNAYFDGEKVYLIDGQDGTIAEWPSDFDWKPYRVTRWEMGIPK